MYSCTQFQALKLHEQYSIQSFKIAQEKKDCVFNGMIVQFLNPVSFSPLPPGLCVVRTAFIEAVIEMSVALIVSINMTDTSD